VLVLVALLLALALAACQPIRRPYVPGRPTTTTSPDYCNPPPGEYCVRAAG
jgi:hypothetical protein